MGKPTAEKNSADLFDSLFKKSVDPLLNTLFSASVCGLLQFSALHLLISRRMGQLGKQKSERQIGLQLIQHRRSQKPKPIA